MTTTPRLKNAAIALLASSSLLLTGCNTIEAGGQPLPPTPTPLTRTPTPTPSATLSASQEKALSAAGRYWVALDKIVRKGGFDQYAIIKALRPTATDDVIQSNLNGARKAWKAGEHVVGTREILSRKAARPGSGGKVLVTFCVSQVDASVANRKGKVVRALPPYLLSLFDMRKRGGSFVVYEAEYREVKKC